MAKRRGNNEGSIYQRKNGLWVAEISLGINEETGKPKKKSIYGKTREEVAIKLNCTIGTKIEYGFIADTKLTLKEEMMKWLISYRQASVESRTFYSSMSNAKNHIFPELGSIQISKINGNVIQNFLHNALRKKKKLGVATVKKIQTLLSLFFDYLVQERMVRDNPVKNTVIKPNDLEKKKATEYKAIRPEHRKPFIEAVATNPFWKTLCLTIMLTSPRIGEILAMKWRNLILDDSEYQGMEIESSVTIDYEFDELGQPKKRHVIEGSTKTAASVRHIPIPNVAAEILREWRTRRELEQELTGISFTAPDDYVFSNNKGQLRSTDGTAHLFQKFLKSKELGQLGIHLHTLRHTFSTILFENNENEKNVQMLLGHKRLATTQIYHSIDKAQLQSTTNRLDRIFGEKFS